MITLIIPSYRNPKYLDFCLEKALEGKSEEETDIIVSVDGHLDLYDDLFEKYSNEDVSFLKLKRNHGMHYAINSAVWQASSEAIVVINEDNVLPKNWDSRLEDVYNPMIVHTINQIEPGTDAPVSFGFVEKNLGDNLEDFDYREFLSYEKTISGWDEETLDGRLFPFMISKKLFMTVDGLDVWYKSSHVVDIDFFVKLDLSEGVRFKRTYDVHFYHFVQKSTKHNENLEQKEVKEIYNKERKAIQQFKYKWGVNPSRDENNKVDVGL